MRFKAEKNFCKVKISYTFENLCKVEISYVTRIFLLLFLERLVIYKWLKM